MTDEQAHDTIEFLASIPTKANAISIDGESHGGGRLTLDVPGTDLAPLLRLTTVRGQVLHITIAPQQVQVFTHDPEPGEGDIPAGDGQSEGLFSETPATISPSGLTIGEDTPHPGFAGTLPAHVHRFQNDMCLDCGERRETMPAPAAAVRARRVSRSVIPKAKKAKR